MLMRIWWLFQRSGQISIIPKPELRGFWGSSLIKPPFRVTSADVVIICPERFFGKLVYPKFLWGKMIPTLTSIGPENRRLGNDPFLWGYGPGFRGKLLVLGRLSNQFVILKVGLQNG